MASACELLRAVAHYPGSADDTRIDEILGLGAVPKSEGSVKIGRWKILGKGSRHTVIACDFRGKDAALKVLRSDAPRGNVFNEADMLLRANSVGVGPKLFAFSEHSLVIERVYGTPLGNHETLGDAGLVECIRSALSQAAKLDEIGVDHGELSRADWHVVFTGRKAEILDFDSAVAYRKCHNYNSLYSYAFRRRSPLCSRLARLNAANGLILPV